MSDPVAYRFKSPLSEEGQWEYGKEPPVGSRWEIEPLFTAEPRLKRIHPLDIPLEVFVEDLSTRPRNIINAEFRYFTNLGDGYIRPPFTVRHLLMFSRKDLRKWPNLGKRSMNEIEEMLRSLGLQLWDEHDERSLRLLREHPMYFPAAVAVGEPNE